ncbi:MAG: hypothetical protein BECKG1743D_GA0114223_102442 [Candidatus Kentron sp. G]|nr:MAG: hypothetical protein BECKG1743F_GA0114225_102295 [Candidatus Kentron sp. G]VFM99204.1 MAG: hypothetical protein BECKG1743E_GA0114224_102405 [Candidatus Kentron sp. G]VFN01027.1 MAG: hypothetical protein BECKG1743D_GA0114223_102442 [Candidatus Kentron sp. G]
MSARMVSRRCAPAEVSPFRMHFVLSKRRLGLMFPVRARTNHTLVHTHLLTIVGAFLYSFLLSCKRPRI